MKRVYTRVALQVALGASAAGCVTDPEPPRVASIAVTPGAVTLDFVGQSAAFTVTVKDQHGNDFAGSVVWTSDAPAVFTVNSSGVVTAVSNGNGRVRAELDGVTGTASVIVSQAPTAVERVGGDAQRGAPGTALSEPLVARVVDAGGSPVVGAAVVFSPAEGSGTATPRITQVDMAGEARAFWTLGDAFGLQSLVASVSEGPNTLFTARAQGPDELAESVDIVSGDGQRGRPSEGLRRPIVVRVLDEHHRPVKGATVLFDAPSGHGFADPDSVRSDGRGEAATTWTLGDRVGSHLLTAFVPDGPSARALATARLGVCGRTPQVVDALVSAASANTCAEVTDAALNQIRELDLHDAGISRLAEFDFDGLSSLESLWLGGNQLAELSAGVFAELTELQRLDLGQNQLTHLPPAAFTGLSSLESLWLNGNRLDELAVGVFAGLSNLKDLLLYGNLLTDLPSGVFTGLPRLESLVLEFNQLSELPSGTFAGLPNLGTLGLGFNQLSELPPGTFTGLPSLEYLYLGANRIELSRGIFAGLSNLESLGLGSNQLSELPSGIFAGLSNLSHLRLAGNQLSELPSGVFTGLRSLEHLYLGSNSIELSRGVFAGLSSLKYLGLYQNQLSELPSGTFAGLPNLETLDLRGNQVTLRSALFAGLPNLETLDLYHNRLTELPSGAFAGLSNLGTLDLGGNQLDLRPGAFAGLSNLEYLKLHENQLTELPSGIFTGLSNLGRLDLWGNHLTELPPGALEGLGRLRALWLHNNTGSPVPLVMRMERTDTTVLSAPGPATLVVTVDEGAPFDLVVNLSAPGGTLARTTVTIATGATRSNTVRVTVNAGTTGSVTVTLGDAPAVPPTICSVDRRHSQGRGGINGSILCYQGFTIQKGDPIRLFR